MRPTETFAYFVSKNILINNKFEEKVKLNPLHKTFVIFPQLDDLITFKNKLFQHAKYDTL